MPDAQSRSRGHHRARLPVLAALAILMPFSPSSLAWAAEDDLVNGVFICHHDPSITFSQPPEGWCQHYLDGDRIQTCAEQNPAVMTTDETVWFVISAFLEEKQWCGVEFGFGAYPSDLFVFTGWGGCATGELLELPTEDWPGSSQGTAMVTVGLPWQGNFEPIYYFTGYVYAEDPGQIPIAADPATDFAGWGNCQVPADTYWATCLPALGIMTSGQACCPDSERAICCIAEECRISTEEACLSLGGVFHPEYNDCGPPNPCEFERDACCVDTVCVLATETECLDMGGEWHPEWHDCDPNFCAGPHRVCCIGESCIVTTEQHCVDLGGEWHLEWASCSPNPCLEPRHVCCLGETCYVLKYQTCIDAEGEWHPEWTSCDPNPCLVERRACCTGERCQVLTAEECAAIWGTWLTDWDSCYPNPCEVPRFVCCSDHECHIMTEGECSGLQGEWYPAWDTCDPNPCPLDSEDILASGVFICHHDPSITYSQPPEGWCAHYQEGYRIESCAEQNPAIESDGPLVWFLLSAFAGERRWCGTEFGFGDYDAQIFAFTEWGACAPDRHLEIPTAGWPGSHEGTAVVATEEPWHGNFEPIYYFVGYPYGDEPGQIPVDVDPATGFGGWGNCVIPLTTYAASCFPAMGIWTEGVVCCPDTSRHVCCILIECHLMLEEECYQLGGEWHPEWDACDPNPCAGVPVLLIQDVSIRQVGPAVEIRWYARPDPRIRAFGIRRAEFPGGQGEILVEIAVHGHPHETSPRVYRDDSVLPGMTYHYWIDALLLGGTVEHAGPYAVTVSGPTSPLLLGTSPNPLLDRATLRFYLPRCADLQLEIHAPSGRLIRTIHAHDAGPGIYEIDWDGRERAGQRAASGAYFFMARLGAARLTGRLTVVR